MKFIKGFLLAAIIAGPLAYGAGYNHGRGAPILSNPFGEETLAQQVQAAKNESAEAGKEIEDFLDDAVTN